MNHMTMVESKSQLCQVACKTCSIPCHELKKGVIVGHLLNKFSVAIVDTWLEYNF